MLDLGTRPVGHWGGAQMKWLLVRAVYAAPPDAVDWDGPWELGMTTVPGTPTVPGTQY
jgi:hypothetical protein